MLILGCSGNHIQPGMWQKVVFWLEAAGITQNALVFTIVLMSMAVIKTLLFRKLNLAHSMKCFVLSWGGTMAALSLGAWCFGEFGATNFHALVALCSGATLLDFTLLKKFCTGFSIPKMLGTALLGNLVATLWLAYLNVPSLFANHWMYTLPTFRG